MGQLKQKELAAALSDLTISNENGTTFLTKKQDSEELVEVLADAFVQDPLFAWMSHLSASESSPNNTSTIAVSGTTTPLPAPPPEIDHRRKLLLHMNQYFFRMIGALTLKHGTVMGVKDKEGSIRGVMCVLAPAAARKSYNLNWIFYAIRRGLPPTHASSTKSDYGKMAAKRMDTLFPITMKRRKELMKTYTKWIYLEAFGVHSSHQGQGVGARLLRSLISAADSLHAHVYLETESTGNEALYKHLGFRTVELLQLHVPGDVSEDAKFTIYLMIRDPQ